MNKRIKKKKAIVDKKIIEPKMSAPLRFPLLEIESTDLTDFQNVDLPVVNIHPIFPTDDNWEYFEKILFTDKK